jgi:hypothetical protein
VLRRRAGKEVAMQGNLLQEILSYLETKYGITSQYLDVAAKK